MGGTGLILLKHMTDEMGVREAEPSSVSSLSAEHR